MNKMTEDNCRIGNPKKKKKRKKRKWKNEQKDGGQL